MAQSIPSSLFEGEEVPSSKDVSVPVDSGVRFTDKFIAEYVAAAGDVRIKVQGVRKPPYVKASDADFGKDNDHDDVNDRFLDEDVLAKLHALSESDDKGDALLEIIDRVFARDEELQGPRKVRRRSPIF